MAAMVASWKSIFRFFSWTKRPFDLKLGRQLRGQLVDKKQLKSLRLEIQDGRHSWHLEHLCFASSPEQKEQLTWNLVCSIGVTFRSKIAKIILMGNPRWPSWLPSWKLFASTPESKGHLIWDLIASIRVTCRPKIAKLFRSASTPELKGQSTWNLVGSIWVTSRSKRAKLLLIRNPRLLPRPPSWKSIFRFFSWTKRPIVWNLVGSIGVTSRSKTAKILLIGNPRWPPRPTSWKSISLFLSWTKRPIDSKLCRKHQGDL